MTVEAVPATAGGRLVAGRYRLQGEIGRGGMAHVCRAHDERLGRDVAIKMLAPSVAADAASVERLRREARVLGGLAHPHVVPIYDLGLDGGQPFLVLQLVEGPSLRQVLRQRGPLDPAEAVRIATEVADALACAHRQGILHGDVKPPNILLESRVEGDSPRALLTDFGVARSPGEEGTSPDDELFGSAPYVAPEVLREGVAAAGPRSDVYALGVVLYEMLVGQRPPGAGSDEGASPVPPSQQRPSVPRALDRVALRALARDPRHRFEDAAHFRAALLEAATSAALDGTRPLHHRQPSTAALAGIAAGIPVPRPAGGRLRAGGALAGGVLAAALLWLAVSRTTVVRDGPLGLLSGGAPATVPALAGMPVADARQALEAAGLRPDETREPTRDTPADVVVTQEPAGAQRAARGSVVRIVVSSGVQVPDLVGQACTRAREAVTPLGWTVRPVRWRIANVEDFGKIVQQEPAAGSVLPEPSAITVQVAGPVRPC